LIARQVQEFHNDVDHEKATLLFINVLLGKNWKQSEPFNEGAMFRAMTEGVIRRCKLIDTIGSSDFQAQTSAFSDFRARSEEAVKGFQVNLSKLQDTFTEHVTRASQAHDQRGVEFTGSQDERGSRFDALYAGHEKNLAQLRQTFLEDIALKAPATYWDEKKKTHHLLSWIFGLSSAAAMTGSVFLIYTFASTFFSAQSVGGAAEAWRLGTLATIVVFAVWATRIIVRIFLSNLHLASDAAERVVMVKTYLSLLEGERLTAPEDRQLILQSLFRPTADGIVKDEGVPLSLAEVLTRTK
jgi:hypothetical protein